MTRSLCECPRCLDEARGIPPEQAAELQLDTMERLMDEHGVAIQHVFGDTGSAPFSYTIGLFLHDLPEFIVFGAGPDLAQPVLNHLATATRDHGTEIEAGDQIDQLLQGQPTVAIGVDDPGEYLGTTFRMRDRRSHARRPIRALQIVLPDIQSRMPWDPGYGWTEVPLLSHDVATSGRTVRMPDLR